MGAYECVVGTAITTLKSYAAALDNKLVPGLFYGCRPVKKRVYSIPCIFNCPNLYHYYTMQNTPCQAFVDAEST